MRKPAFLHVIAAASLALAGVAAWGPAPAHGEFDEQLEAFHEHLDDYRADVESLVEETETIARARAAGEDVGGRLEGFIELWEDVGVHGAIETRATVTYPGIWQAIVALQDAEESGVAADEFQALVGDLQAALWQGLGAVRLAASQVESGQATAGKTAHEDEHEATEPAAVVDAIVADLREAVSAYESGDKERANELISRAYIQRFEGLEGDLIEQDPDLVTNLEKDFNATLPMAMQRGEPVAEVRAELERMIADLETARQLLEESAESRSEVF